MARKRKKRGGSRVRLSSGYNRTPKRRRTRRRRLGAGKANAGSALMGTLQGAVGGALYLAPQVAFTVPMWAKILLGFGMGFGGHYMGYSNIGSGATGAMVYDVGRSALALADMMPTEYVDSDTLSESGYYDAAGNMMLQDDAGNLFALNDGGEYEMIADGDGLQNLSLTPVNLQDPFSLSDPYSLAGY